MLPTAEDVMKSKLIWRKVRSGHFFYSSRFVAGSDMIFGIYRQIFKSLQTFRTSIEELCLTSSRTCCIRALILSLTFF